MSQHRRSSSTVHRLLASCSLVLAALGGCDEKRPLTELRDGPAECAELEAACRAPAEALGESYADCYQAGKSMVSNACINYYYGCIDKCRAASDALGVGGGSGAAGSAGESGSGGHGD